MNDLCKGCGFSIVPNPSSVMTSSSPTSRRAIEHVLVSAPPTMAAQAPHCPRPQPNLGPFNPRSFRSTYGRGESGTASTTLGSPFTVIPCDIVHPRMNVNDLTRVSPAGRTHDCAKEPTSLRSYERRAPASWRKSPSLARAEVKSRLFNQLTLRRNGRAARGKAIVETDRARTKGCDLK